MWKGPESVGNEEARERGSGKAGKRESEEAGGIRAPEERYVYSRATWQNTALQRSAMWKVPQSVGNEEARERDGFALQRSDMSIDGRHRKTLHSSGVPCGKSAIGARGGSLLHRFKLFAELVNLGLHLLLIPFHLLPASVSVSDNDLRDGNGRCYQSKEPYH